MSDDTAKGRLFTQEEVRTIFSRAAGRQGRSHAGLTYEEIVDTARQAGISEEDIRAAVSEAASAPPVAQEDEEVRTEIAARAWAARRAFAIHFAVYVMVMVLLAVINWQTWREGDSEFWVLYPLFGWGIGITAHFTAVGYAFLFPDPRAVERVRIDVRRRRKKRGGRESELLAGSKEDARAAARPNVRVDTSRGEEEPSEEDEPAAEADLGRVARRR